MAKVYTGVSESWYDDYERGRPGWPPEVVGVAELRRSSTVLELGPGTGKLTRLLAAAFEDVVAVDPDEGMRRLFDADARLLAGSAEEIPLPDASVDAVFVAEAFHNFDGERAVVEITRVLRPRGALVLMWNVPAGPTEPSIGAVERLLNDHVPAEGDLGYDPLDLNTRRFASGEWRLPFAGSAFEEFREVRLANPQTVDRSDLVAFFASMGWIADLPDTERLPLLDEAASLLDADEYRRPWETRVHWTRRTA